MMEDYIKKNITDKLGLYLFIGSLIFYFLMELPFTLSVSCGNVNEGFYFGYGQHFLEGSHLYRDIYAARGPLFILFYALVVKIFGFGGWSIIAIHAIHSMIVSLIAIAIYLISKKIFQSSFYSGLAVIFWVLIQLSPIGQWGNYFEYESSFSLEAENFCVLLSLLSIYCLFSTYENTNNHKKNIILSFISGLLATCSMMFKGSGAVIAIAVFCWAIYLVLFQNKVFKTLKYGFVLFFTGLCFSLLVTFLALYIHNGELSSFLSEYYALGYYSDKPTQSIGSFFLSIFNFMLRYVNSPTNFILFFLAFLFFIVGLIKPLHPLFSLICIWGLGSACAVIAPGAYSSYYYILVWPSVVISLAYGLKMLFRHVKLLDNKLSKALVVVFISLFFIERFCITLPTYIEMTKREIDLNLFYEPESFQDPLESLSNKKPNPKRPSFLKVADLINSYLSNKKDTFYIFNFVQGHQDFSPYIYIYAKRTPSSTVYSDWLHVERLVNKSMEALIKDLVKRPPKVLIIPEKIFLKQNVSKLLTPFFNNLTLYLRQKYHLIDTFNYPPTFSSKEKSQNILVFERNQD